MNNGFVQNLLTLNYNFSSDTIMDDSKIPILNKQMFIAILIFAFLLCGLTLSIQLIFSQMDFQPDNRNYQLFITPANHISSSGSDKDQTLDIKSTETPVLAGVIGVGMQATISDTEDKGLRMRRNAGFEAEIDFLAHEDEIVEILDGPLIEDGVIWWKIQSLNDPSKIGWSVQDYLSIIQN